MKIINNLNEAIKILNEYADYNVSYNILNTDEVVKVIIINSQITDYSNRLTFEETIALAQKVYNEYNPDYDKVLHQKLDKCIELLGCILLEIKESNGK